MSKEIEFKSLSEATEAVDKAYKAKGTKKPRKREIAKPDLKIYTVLPVATEIYRDNYEAIFGHK